MPKRPSRNSRTGLTMLRSDLPTLGERMPTLDAPAVPRMRGRGLMQRRERWLRAHPLCVHCTAEGGARPATELDHIVPLFKGGADDESNLQGLCTEHHAAKTASEAKLG